MRLTWHGYPDTYATFLAMPLSDRFLALEELNALIDISNEQSAGRPKDDR